MKRLLIILVASILPLGCYFLLNEEDEVAPEAPSALIATIETSNLGVRFVRLRWQDNSNNERGFDIARKPGTGIYSVIQMTPQNSTSWDDYPPDTQFGTTYTYKVRSITNFKGSEYSNEVTITFM